MLARHAGAVGGAQPAAAALFQGRELEVGHGAEDALLPPLTKSTNFRVRCGVVISFYTWLCVYVLRLIASFLSFLKATCCCFIFFCQVSGAHAE